jgi:hypothetical protein
VVRWVSFFSASQGSLYKLYNHADYYASQITNKSSSFRLIHSPMPVAHSFVIHTDYQTLSYISLNLPRPCLLSSRSPSKANSRSHSSGNSPGPFCSSA